MEGKASPKCRGRSSRPATCQSGLPSLSRVRARARLGVLSVLMARSGSLRREQHANRAGENAQVQAQAPVLDVSEIEVHVEFERRTVARGNLPETRDARLHIQATELVKFVVIDLIDGMRPRSNQAHVSAQHVPELRKLIEAVATDDAPDARDSGVVVNLEDRTLPLVASAQVFLKVFRVRHHGAKLIAPEATALRSRAFRGVNDRAG